jgi:hypothetical protein
MSSDLTSNGPMPAPTLELFLLREAGGGSEAVPGEAAAPADASRPIFSSTGSWLHPLFELERFLAESGTDPAACVLRDKLIGKAAALLIVRLGIRDVRTGVLSSLGEAVLVAWGVRYHAEERVERILCRTEELLATVDDPEEAYRLICARIASL